MEKANNILLKIHGMLLLTAAADRLADSKKWFITTPAVVLLVDGTVRNSWEEKTPDLEAVLRNIAMLMESGPIEKH